MAKEKKVTECMMPFTTTAGDVVPCGKCHNCHIRRVSQWSFRLSVAEKHSISSWFITLTYDTKEVPITKQGFMSLQYKDVQKFLKKLRKRNNHKLLYYVVGEYGKKRNRPHYHMLLFNLENPEYVIKEWTKGEVFFGSITDGSIGYVLKYMHKSTKSRYYRNDDREASRGYMSKGLGLEYVTENAKAWHKAKLNERCFVNSYEQKVSMPRYYRLRIYSEEERATICTHIQNTKVPYEFKRMVYERHGELGIQVYNDIVSIQEKYGNFQSQKNEKS